MISLKLKSVFNSNLYYSESFFKTGYILLLIYALTAGACCKSADTLIKPAPEEIPGKTETDNSLRKDMSVSLSEASEAYYSGDFEKSAALFKELSREEPYNKRAVLSLVMLLNETGSYDESYRYLSSLADSDSIEELPMNSGSLWEYTELPLFLGGRVEEYLKTAGEPGFFSAEEDSIDLKIKNDILSEKLFFTALAFKDAGDTDTAAEMLEKALNRKGYFPSASLLLGQYYFEKSDFALAGKNLSTALRLDSNQTAGRVILAKTILAEGRLSEGHAALKRAAAVRPWDINTALFLKEFEDNNPDIINTKIAVEEKRRLAASVKKASVFTPEPEIMPQVRVGLADDLRELYIKPGGDFQISGNSNLILFEGEKNQILKITSTHSTVHIKTEDNNDIAETAGTLSISCKSPADTILMFNVVHSTGYLSAGKEDRTYRGKISLRPENSRITVINTLPLEEYLYSVVPSEIPSYWPEEALCTQAVAARSYTLANMGKFGKKGYDVSGSIKSAFYRGLTGENEKTTAAVEKTRGIVLKAEDKYLNAFYSANSAGRTESAESVWGGKYPLTGVTDPHLSFESDPPAPYELARWILSEPESFSSHPDYYYRSSYRWRLIVTADEIEAINRHSVGDIISITTRGRGNSGRVEKILIKGTEGEQIIKGDKIRNSLGGLRSSLFIMMPKLDKKGMPEYFIFAGAGWGHGVGMCQTGAAGMAHEGYSYSEILNHYYPQAELTSIY